MPALQPSPGTFHGLSSVVHDQEADGDCLEGQEQCFTPRAAESRVGREKGGPGKRQASLHSHPSGLAHSEGAHVTTTWVCGTSGRAEVFFTLVRAVGTRAGQVGQQVKELA